MKMTDKEKRERIRLQQANIGELKACLEISQAEIDELQAALEKPNLRDGDYGNSPAGWWVRAGEKVYYGGSEQDEASGLSDSYFIDQGVQGNISDYLNPEPLEEFETDVHKYYFDILQMHAPIYMAGNWHTIKEAEEHHKKLGRLLATAIKKAGG